MSYSSNMQAMQNASKLVSEMIQLVRIYELGSVNIAGNVSQALTPQQITQLKMLFVSKRNECKAELDKVAG